MSNAIILAYGTISIEYSTIDWRRIYENVCKRGNAISFTNSLFGDFIDWLFQKRHL